VAAAAPAAADNMLRRVKVVIGVSPNFLFRESANGSRLARILPIFAVFCKTEAGVQSAIITSAAC
jgi:hypothetical protein